MQAITSCLWFDQEAEAAAKFYLSVFKQGKILKVRHYPAGSPGPEGGVMTVEFEILGQRFTALNGGPMFKFTEAVSFMVSCKTQREIDYFWTKLSAGGGKKGPCGWLKDKFGLSWQLVPEGLDDLFNDDDPARAERAMRAMLKMSKLDIKKLREAAAAERKKKK